VTQQQEVARHIYEADGAWMRTSEIAALADMMDRAGSVSAYISNLRQRGLIESRSAGTTELQHRAKDREALGKFIGIADGADEERFTHRKRAATPAAIQPSPAPLADALRAAGNGKQASKPPEPPKASAAPPEAKKLDKPSAAGLTWAIDHRGKLILCFGEAAFELQPPQWSGLAKFLHPLADVFA